MRDLDWSRTPLGPAQSWPQSLRTAVRLILNCAHPMYIFWGPESTCLYNDAYRQSIGPERHPGSLGQPAQEVWSEIWDIIGPQIAQVMSGGGPTWHQNALVPITRNGVLEDVYWTYTYSPIDDEGAPHGVGGVLVVCSETTEAVMAERHAKRESERFARLFDQAPSFMTVLRGREHRFEYANPRYYELVGHRDIVGKTVAEALPEAAAQGYVELLDNVYATGDAYVGRASKFAIQAIPGAQPDERYVDFVYQPIRNNLGEIEGIFVEGLDVTERELAAKRAAALAELGDLLLDTGEPDDIAYAAAEMLGRTLQVSRAGYGTIHTTDETIHIERDWNMPGVESLAGILHFRDYGSYIDDLKVGKTVVVHDADADSRTAATADALKAINAHSLVNMPVTEQGGFVALLYLNHATPRRWSADELAFIREVAQRTHTAVERRRAEMGLRALATTLEQRVEERTDQLVEAESRLRQSQKMEAIGQLTGGIAHDFNNMLTGILSAVHIIRRRIAKGQLDDLERFMEAAESSATRAANLTERLLAFSRRQSLDSKPLDINRLVRGLDELIKRSFNEDITLELLLGTVPPAVADSNQLENALLNLVINARDAMPGGGKISIRTFAMDLSEPVEAKAFDLKPGQFVAVEIADTGVGMSREVLEKVFEPFFTTKPIGQGTGLGLSMVYGFAQQSNGQVRVKSRPGEGTAVTIYLPAGQQQASTNAALKTPPSKVAGSGQIILIVEDDSAVRLLVRESINELGYESIETAEPQSAVAALQSNQPIDLMITDVGLPGMNGRQLAEIARQHRPELPILFMTGYAENAAIRSRLVGNNMSMIMKPFAFDALAVKLAELLQSDRHPSAS